MASLSVHDLQLESLDELVDVDALCLFVAEDERPLRGISGYVDWRLCGGLSRVIKNGFFVGAAQDWLLLPSNGRIGPMRIFVVGLGKRATLDADALGKALSMAARTLTRAKVDSVALEVPVPNGGDEGLRAGILTNQFMPEFKGRKVALLADKAFARALPSGQSASRSGS